MMGGIINVNDLEVADVVAKLTVDTVHVEPGEDKITFANDVASWVLARIVPDGEHTSSDSQARSKL